MCGCCNTNNSNIYATQIYVQIILVDTLLDVQAFTSKRTYLYKEWTLAIMQKQQMQFFCET